MSYQQVSLNPKALLAAINENLNRHFFVDSRDSAKQLYLAINDGQTVPLMRIDTGEAGEVRCELTLDTSLYVGKVNFGRFRKSLMSMMSRIDEDLNAEEKLNALSTEQGEIMFNAPGVIDEDGQLNILVCSFRSLGPGLANVRLKYLDPAEYASSRS